MRLPDVVKWSVVLVGLLLYGFMNLPEAAANTITVDGTCDLVEAIRNANSTAALPPEADCAAGDPLGADEILLNVDTSLTAIPPENTTRTGGGFAGTPSITSTITIRGVAFSPSIIERAVTTCPPGATDSFRLFDIRAGGNLTLERVTLRNGCIANNATSGFRHAQGGAIFNNGTLALIRVTLSNNTVQGANNTNPQNVSGGDSYGGAIYNTGVITRIDSSLFEFNVANTADINLSGSVYGGAIYNGGRIDLITNTSIARNTAEAGSSSNNGDVYGGGLYNGGTITLMERTGVVLNTANSGTSGFSASGGNGYGGGIYNGGNLTIRDSGIGGNYLRNAEPLSSIVGGGIANGGGTLSITNSLIYQNTAHVVNVSANCCATMVGAGLGVNGGSVTLINSTVSTNRGIGNFIDGGGIGLWGYTGATLTVRNSTIVNNSLERNSGTGTENVGGGLYATHALTFSSNILANNRLISGGTSVDCFNEAAWTSSNYNLIEDLTGCNITLAASDLSGVDPNLGALGMNGGITQTHAVLAGSPVIDKGNCTTAGLTTDQRGGGFPRPLDDLAITNAADGCDMGAFETNLLSLSATVDFENTTGVFTEGAAANYVPRFRLVLSGTGTYTGTVSVNLSYSGAVDTGDYTSISPFSFNVTNLAAGTYFYDFNLPVSDDLLIENPELLQINITQANVTLGTNSSHAVTLGDNDTATLTLTGAATIGEAAGNHTATVILVPGQPGVTLAPGVQVEFSVGRTNTSTEDVDFTTTAPVTGTITGADVPVSTGLEDDNLIEGDEDFQLALGITSAPAGVTLGIPANLTVTIQDNDMATLALVAATGSIAENAGDQITTVVLTTSNGAVLAPEAQLPFTLTRQDVTTNAGDFGGVTVVTPDLVFVGGEGNNAIRTVTTPIFNDDSAEGNEDYELVLALGTLNPPTLLATLGTDVQLVTIVDDDVPNVLVLESGNTTGVNEATPAVGDTFTVELTSDPTAPVQVTLNVTDGQTRIGRPGGPYATTLTLTFYPGAGSPVAPDTLWNDPQTVEVVAVDDTVLESSPHAGQILLAVDSSSASEYVAVTVPALNVTITDNEQPPVVVVPPVDSPPVSTSSSTATFKDTDFIIKTVDKTLAAVGDRLRYSIVFTNPKGITLNQVVVTDIVDARLSDVRVISASQGTVVINGNTVVLTGITLLPGQRVTLEIEAVITAQAVPGSVITNSATLESPDASIHVSNVVATTILPGSLPATGQAPWWRFWLLLVIPMSLLVWRMARTSRA